MRRSLHLALAAAAISLVGAVPALAASTGLENIHTLRREHGRLWSRFNRAANRSVACDETYGNHTCNVSGRPCRR